MEINTIELLEKAEANVNNLRQVPFEERLEKSLMPEKETGTIVFLTESERIALEIGKELIKAYSESADEDEEQEPETDDGGFGAATEGDEDEEGD
jgi:hypothetical protein